MRLLRNTPSGSRCTTSKQQTDHTGQVRHCSAAQRARVQKQERWRACITKIAVTVESVLRSTIASSCICSTRSHSISRGTLQCH